MPKDTPLSHGQVNKDISRKCDQHPGESVKYYCKSHDLLGCNICFIKGHRNCSIIESIEEMSESITESQEYKDFITVLNLFAERSRSNIKMLEHNLPKSRSWCSDVAKSVRKLRKKINSILVELEQNIIVQAGILQKKEEKKLVNVSDRVTTYLQSVEKLAEEFDNLKTSRKVCEIYIKVKESKNEVKSMHAILDKAEKENVVTRYVFNPSTKLKEFLNSQNGFGKLSVTAAAQTLPYSDPVIFYTRATHVADIEVKSGKDERTCSITGAAIVSNKRLVIVDHNNIKVKLIDTQSNKVINELIASNWPWDVTVIGRNQVAVTVYDSGKILFLSVSDTLTLNREITLGGQCHGVANNKDRLVVTYTDPVKLEIMDLYGKVLTTVQNDREGNKLFKCPGHVCVSKDGETIYVSDYTDKKLTSLTFDGVVKFAYSESELGYPQKVSVDHHGKVYVCDGENRNVIMLTANLYKVRNILTQADGLESVYSASHCQDTNRLFVGMCCNKVKVFQLSQ